MGVLLCCVCVRAHVYVCHRLMAQRFAFWPMWWHIRSADLCLLSLSPGRTLSKSCAAAHPWHDKVHVRVVYSRVLLAAQLWGRWRRRRHFVLACC